MCLFPKLIRNPKYRVNKKNKGNIPYMQDQRIGFVPIGCGMCSECMKQKSNSWRVRLLEDIKEHTNGIFVTLTFSNESYTELGKGMKSTGYLLDNEISTLAVRRFLERWRKKYKKSVRHWLVTELGHGETEHLHLHGIIYTDKPLEIERIWKYGFVWIGKQKNGTIKNYVSERTVNYIVKYITKTDPLHKWYKPRIYCSPGIGANYIKSYNAKKNKFKGEKTKTTYTTRQGVEYNLPIYWRNKIYTEEEREKLWLIMLDRNVRYIAGEPVNANDEEAIDRLLKFHRRMDKKMGYGSPDNWEAKKYEIERRKLNQAKRMAKNKKKNNKG